MRALIVESDAIVALDLQSTLIRLGYEDICHACHTQDALVKVKEQCIQLIIMDASLQRAMDGIEVAQQIRKISNAPIVYLVSHMDKDAWEKAEETIPFSYVIKPFEENEFRSAIMSLTTHN
jgi:CheY-like chemotaxis protein